MEYPTNKVAWKEIAKDGLPSREEFGPCPNVLVAMACAGQAGYGHPVRHAELRFFGKDPARPYWCCGTKEVKPIENSSWHVTHWAARVAPPEES